MAVAFTPQGTTPTASPETNTPDVFELDTIPQTEPVLESPEQATDFVVETESQPENTVQEKPLHTDSQEVAHKKRPAVQTHPANTYTQPDPLTFQIEKIMEEGIAEAYQELTPVQKQQFKIKGENTAKQIKALLQTTRVKVKKIFKLLLEWLQLLPGVNRFFLMQDAKIKTDKILALKDNHK